MNSHETPLEFVPSRVEGLPDIVKVWIHSDRLDFTSEVERRSFPFLQMAEWPSPKWLWRWLAALGMRPRLLMVGERDFCCRPRYFRFFTIPPITIRLPEDPEGTTYGNTLFRQIQDVMLSGGFGTWDLA